MSDTRVTASVLTTLGQARESFLGLARWLATQPPVTGVKSGFDVRSYQSGTRTECFVEAELRTGNAVCWWIDLRDRGGEWLVEPGVFIQLVDRQEPLTEFSPRSIRSDSDLPGVLGTAVTELLSQPEAILDAAVNWTEAPTG